MAKQLQELHHELIDSLCASELHDFIHSEIDGLEMQLSSAIAKLILGGRRSGHYINVNVLTSNKAARALFQGGKPTTTHIYAHEGKHGPRTHPSGRRASLTRGEKKRRRLP